MGLGHCDLQGRSLHVNERYEQRQTQNDGCEQGCRPKGEFAARILLRHPRDPILRRRFAASDEGPVGAGHRSEATRLFGPMDEPAVAVIMGSRSDWETMKHVCETLDELGVSFETRVVSAHRTPDLMAEYARTAADRGVRVIVAGAGGAAHLPGMTAAHTHLPVLGVPVESKTLKGMDSLLSIVQMPAGVPVGTLAIGRSGAINAALLAASIIALSDESVRERLMKFREAQTESVLANPDPS